MSYYAKYEGEDAELYESKSDEVDAMHLQEVCRELCSRTGEDFICIESEAALREDLTQRFMDDVLNYEPEFDKERYYEEK